MGIPILGPVLQAGDTLLNGRLGGSGGDGLTAEERLRRQQAADDVTEEQQ